MNHDPNILFRELCAAAMTYSVAVAAGNDALSVAKAERELEIAARNYVRWRDAVPPPSEDVLGMRKF